jgi:hypothetical protein
MKIVKLTKRSDRYVNHGEELINHGKSVRCVIDIEGYTWPAESPEECKDDSISGDWYMDMHGNEYDQYLLCRGCGLDCT